MLPTEAKETEWIPFKKKKPFSRKTTAGEGFLTIDYLTECGATNEIIFAVSSRDVNLDGLNLPL